LSLFKISSSALIIFSSTLRSISAVSTGLASPNGLTFFFGGAAGAGVGEESGSSPL